MFKNKCHSTKGQLSAANKHLLESIENFKHEISKKLDSAGAETKKFATKNCDNLENLIKEHPFQATGIALISGIALALLAKTKWF